jgi:hypothetical protein
MGAAAKERTYFLKKETKKLLFIQASGPTGTNARFRKLFGSFFKKEHPSRPA